MALEVKVIGIRCRAVIDGLCGVASAPTVIAWLGDDKVEALWLYPLYSGFSNIGVIDKNRYDRAVSPPLGSQCGKCMGGTEYSDPLTHKIHDGWDFTFGAFPVLLCLKYYLA